MSERQDELRAEAVAAIAADADTFAFHWHTKSLAFRCQQEWEGGATAEQWWPMDTREFHAMIQEAFAPLRASLAAAEAKLADAEKHADELAALLDRYDDKTADDAVTAHAARRAARDGDKEGTR